MEFNVKQEDYREQALKVSSEFKTSWVKLGEFLNIVASEKLYIEWGYPNFQQYCNIELKIKKNTAIKLTNAYFFITEEEPALKEKEIDLEAISALSKVKKNENCTQDLFMDMLDLAEKGKSGATINKKFKEYCVQSGDETQEFFKKSSRLAKNLLNWIKPVGSVHPRYKDTLGEMVSSFDAESQVKEDK